MGFLKSGHGRIAATLGCVVGLVLVALVVVAPASATNIRYYVASATSSPSPLKAGKTGTVTVTLKNCKSTVSGCGSTTSNAGIGSAKITLPSGFTVSSVSSVSPASWTSSVSGNVVKVKGSSSTRVSAGNALTVTIAVTAPSTAKSYTVATNAYYGTNWSDYSFTRKGSDPSVSVVKPPLDSLTFSPQPGTQTAGAPFSVTVLGRDADGNPVSGSSVALSLLTSPPGAPALPATSGVLDANGSATFTNLSLTKAGSYSFRASSGSIQGDSNAFDVGAAALASLAFAAQPVDVTAGASFGVTVLGKDQYGNDVSGESVSLAFGANPGDAALLGNAPSTLAGGSAAFSGLSIQKAGVDYTLVASAAGVDPVESSSFDVTAAGLSKLVFAQQPTEVVVGATISPAVTVKGTDAYDNLVAGSVSLALVDGPAGATLGGTTTAVLDGTGIATFADLNVDTAGLDAKLKAEGGSGSVTSDPFDIVSAKCETNGVDCSATTDPNGTGPTPTNNTVGAVAVIDNGTGSGDGSLLIKLDGDSSCTGAVGTPVGQALLVVPTGFAGAFAKVTVTYDASITPNASWKYKFCVDKGSGVVKPNIPLCLVGALGYSDNPLLDALSWLFNYSAYQSAINSYVTTNGPCILRRGRVSGGDLRVEIYMLATDPRVSGFGSG